MVTQLAILLQQLNTKHYTYNPYNKLINRIAERYAYCGEDELKLFKLLVHGITLLNKVYRIKDKNRYVVQREDVLIALDLMGESVSPFSKMSNTNTEYYHALFKIFGTLSFNRKDVEFKLRISKTHANRVLKDLTKKGLLIKSGHRGSGYYYEINRW